MTSSAETVAGYTHEFLTEFIELYRSYPCLWHISCRAYKDRLLRSRAYDALAQKLRQVNPIADRDTVIRKINTLRTAFRREYKKVRISQKNIKNPRHWYRSSLWYYDKLKFIVDQNEECPPHRSTFSAEEENCPKEESVLAQGTGSQNEMMTQPLVNKIELVSPGSSPSTTPHSHFQPVIVETEGNVTYNRRFTSAETPDLSKRKYHQYEAYQDPQSKDVICDSMPRHYSVTGCVSDDHFETFGQYVASKLRKSVSRQSSIAEKLISDVLLRANLGTLHEDTSLTEKIPPRCFLVSGDR